MSAPFSQAGLEQGRAGTGPTGMLAVSCSPAGLRWHVQMMGTGPQVLLLHGAGAATHSWRDVAPLLARDFTVIAPDLPGHGFTDTPRGRRLIPKGNEPESG